MGLRRGRWTVGVAVILAVTLAAAGLVLWRLQGSTRVVTAHFSRVVGIYEGSDVRILGVKVGEIRTVVPEGRSVRVSMEYDARYRIPADARAVIVPPSLVSDRYIQLTPAYRGGPALPDGADLPLWRGVTPLELDDVYAALDELATALGPGGANATGELSRLLSVGRDNLEGNGERLGETLRGLSAALETLADSREDMFGSIDNLQRFTEMLADTDTEVRRFNRQLAGVSEQLAAERDELSAALRNLGIALRHVAKFVKDNRAELVRNVDALTDVSAALVRQREALIDVLDIGPTGMQNLALSYNAKSGTTDTRSNLMGPYDAAGYVCSLMVRVLSADEIPKECFALAAQLHRSGAPMTPELGKLLGLSLPPLPNRGEGTPADRDATLPLPSGEVGDTDPTFGGILGGLS